MRTIVRSSMALVALAAAALSYQSLMALAELAGYGALSVLYPLVVDAGAAASCAAWLHTRGRQPLVMTWCLLAVSVVLNGTTHYLESTHTAPSWLLVVAVAAVPPTVLGLTVHLAVDLGPRPAQRMGGTESAEAHPTQVGVRDGVNGAALDRPGQNLGEGGLTGPTAPGTPSSGGPADCSDPVADLLAQGAGRRKLAAELGISEHQARRLLAASRNGDGR